MQATNLMQWVFVVKSLYIELNWCIYIAPFFLNDRLKGAPWDAGGNWSALRKSALLGTPGTSIPA